MKKLGLTAMLLTVCMVAAACGAGKAETAQATEEFDYSSIIDTGKTAEYFENSEVPIPDSIVTDEVAEKLGDCTHLVFKDSDTKNQMYEYSYSEDSWEAEQEFCVNVAKAYAAYMEDQGYKLRDPRKPDKSAAYEKGIEIGDTLVTFRVSTIGEGDDAIPDAEEELMRTRPGFTTISVVIRPNE